MVSFEKMADIHSEFMLFASDYHFNLVGNNGKGLVNLKWPACGTKRWRTKLMLYDLAVTSDGLKRVGSSGEEDDILLVLMDVAVEKISSTSSRYTVVRVMLELLRRGI